MARPVADRSGASVMVGHQLWSNRWTGHFGNMNWIWNRSCQSAPLSGAITFQYALSCMFTGSRPRWKMCPTPPPTGTVQRWPPLASQLAVRIAPR